MVQLKVINFQDAENAGRSWKILFTLIITQPLNFSAFSRDLLHERTFFNVLCMFFCTVDVVVVVVPTAFNVVKRLHQEYDIPDEAVWRNVQLCLVLILPTITRFSMLLFLL